MLPGPPRELKPIVQNELIPRLRPGLAEYLRARQAQDELIEAQADA